MNIFVGYGIMLATGGSKILFFSLIEAFGISSSPERRFSVNNWMKECAHSFEIQMR